MNDLPSFLAYAWSDQLLVDYLQSSLPPERKHYPKRQSLYLLEIHDN